MINRSEKGRRIEALAAGLLRGQGYVVHRVLRPSYSAGQGFRLQTDVFSCIDLIAKKADAPTRWIQVTAGSDIGRKAAKLLIVPWTIHDAVEIWRWIGGEGKRTDRRTGLPRNTRYFQVYRWAEGFALHHDDAHCVQAAKDDEASEDAWAPIRP